MLALTDFMKFGKHKGTQVEDLLYDDPSYVAWLIDEEVCEFDEHVLKLAEELKII